MNNTIKRTTTVIYYECLVNTNACKAGQKCVALKMNYGWVTKIIGDKEPVFYQTFISHLRNPNYTRIINQK